jgi:hypothetical protein
LTASADEEAAAGGQPDSAPGLPPWLVPGLLSALILVGFVVVAVFFRELELARHPPREEPEAAPAPGPTSAPRRDPVSQVLVERAPPRGADPDRRLQGSGLGSTTTRAGVTGVRVGQKYHYELRNAGMNLGQTWEVTRVTPREIKYDLITSLDGRVIGEPVELSWSVPPRSQEPSSTTTQIEEVLVAGRLWRAMRLEADDYVTWVPVDARGVHTWPPILRQEKAGEVTNELTQIEEP